MTTEQRQAFWEAVESGDNTLLSVMHGLVEKWGLTAISMCRGDIGSIVAEEADRAKELTNNQRGMVLGDCAKGCNLSDQMQAERKRIATNDG